MKKVVLFDGDCSFCNKSVQFILKRDKKKQFLFSSLQGEFVKGFHVPSDIDSILFFENGRVHTKSSAVLRICVGLNGFWKVFSLMLVIPKPLRDVVYDFVAKRRKNLMKDGFCLMPKEEEKSRFLP